ncbi:MAG: DNA-binding protein [Omnitrophica bacterium RIFCSPLOWO2_01_FULL_45_10]|nr:MAG: DNA-binding protein [Omnitrophica bacterium RIFCSPLOWO2_01_FULL_45_10]
MSKDNRLRLGALIRPEVIAGKIHSVRGKRVMLDYDLAFLYGVETKYLKRQVRRNRERFPEDFMFELTEPENLRCQNVTSNRGGRRYLPYAFTEQGVSMLSSVLNSKQAVMVNIQIMRAFVTLKRAGLTYAVLRKKIDEMEKKYDRQFKSVFDAIRELMTSPPEKPKPRIGFHE